MNIIHFFRNIPGNTQKLNLDNIFPIYSSISLSIKMLKSVVYCVCKTSICKLKHLRHFHLSGCSKLKEIHKILGDYGRFSLSWFEQEQVSKSYPPHLKWPSNAIGRGRRNLCVPAAFSICFCWGHLCSAGFRVNWVGSEAELRRLTTSKTSGTPVLDWWDTLRHDSKSVWDN